MPLAARAPRPRTGSRGRARRGSRAYLEPHLDPLPARQKCGRCLTRTSLCAASRSRSPKEVSARRRSSGGCCPVADSLGSAARGVASAAAGHLAGTHRKANKHCQLNDLARHLGVRTRVEGACATSGGVIRRAWAVLAIPSNRAPWRFRAATRRTRATVRRMPNLTTTHPTPRNPPDSSPRRWCLRRP